MKPSKDVVALRIRIIKERLGLSIANMAERVGTSKSNLNAYLRAVSLPPEKIAENISSLGGYSSNWVYYGDDLDYIKELMIYMGFDEFLKDYPFIIEEINEEFEDLMQYSGYQDWSKEELISGIVIKKYNEAFDKYILEIIKPFLSKIDTYQFVIGGKEYNRNNFISRVKNLIKSEMPLIYYGEKDRIYSIAEKQFNDIVKYIENSTPGIFGAQNIVELFANNLGSDEEIEDFLKRIASYENVKFDNNDPMTKEFKDKLKKFHNEIMHLIMKGYD